MPGARAPLPRWLVLTQTISLVVIVALVATLVPVSKRAGVGPYPLLARRLFLEHPNDVLINFTGLRQQVRDYIGRSPERIGMYFEYLPTGVNINVGANDEFFRASLIKLPVVMRAYKFVETGALSLDEVRTVEERQVHRGYGELWKRGAGTRIAIRDLIPLILCQSDNTAFNVLYERVNVELLGDRPDGDVSARDVYDFLDIPRRDSGVTDMTTPKNFASILKCLYFSAYLSFEHSNEILETMTRPHPEEWLRAGVRKGIPVADKIGAYSTDPAALFVHSDGGIVFYPRRPYILSIMVHSGELEASVKHIRTLSRMVFDYVDTVPE